jgi:sec-independent protein translocase protein TatB
MFDVGFAELFLLALIGLLVLGPERLPGVARTVGGYVRKARSSWISLRNTIEAELAEADLATPIKKTSEELKQIGKDLADMSAFTPDKQESVAQEPQAIADADADAEQKPDPVTGSNSSKEENA